MSPALSAQAYLDHFSRALQYEYASKGIFVQSLIPFCVATGTASSFLHKCPWLVPSPKVYAHHAVATLGISKRTTGYWSHSVQVCGALRAEVSPSGCTWWGSGLTPASVLGVTPSGAGPAALGLESGCKQAT